MAAHRYWRATAFEAYGEGDLELSEFHLLAAGTRVDAAATLTSSAAPDVSGALADLKDDVLATAARWSLQAIHGLTLQWDFGGSPVDADDIRLAGDSEWRFPLIVSLQWSNDAVAWETFKTYSGITWPGKAAKSVSPLGYVQDPYASSVSSLLNFEGADGSTTFTDATGKTWTSTAQTISTAWAGFGTSSGRSLGGAGTIRCATSSDFDVGSGDFTIEMLVRPTSTSGNQHIFGKYGDTGSTSLGMAIYMSSGGSTQFLASVTGTGWDIFGFTFGTFTAGETYHLAVTRLFGIIRTFTNGSLMSAASGSGSVYNGDSPRISVASSSSPGATDSFTGYIDEFRFTKGVARYVAAFTPPEKAHSIVGETAIAQNRVRGRAATNGLDALSLGPVLPYGTPALAQVATLTVQSGAVKDLATGVRGQGIGRIQGTVKITPDAPTHRKVRLVRDIDGLLVRELWSDPATGAYDFQYVDEAQAFTVITYDHLHNYRAVVADNIMPELMP